MDEPRPQSIRDLRLMYETARRIDGTIEYKRLMPKVRSSRDYHDGDITGSFEHNERIFFCPYCGKDLRKEVNYA